MFKKIYFKNTVRNRISKGINILSNSVKITLGPKGKNVIIEKKFSNPIVTKDGVTVAKEIILKNKLENIGAQMVKEVASKTNDDAGDGTTTATVLSQSIIKEGFKYIALGINPLVIKKEINNFLKIILKRLSKNSKKIKSDIEICQVGSISANNDISIGKMISKAMKKVGIKGVISLDEGKFYKDELEIVEGMSFDSGYISRYFLEENKKSIILENSYILIYYKKINNFREILPILEKISKIGKPLLIISENIDNDILNTLILNNLKGTLKVVAVKTPGFGDRKISSLEDICINTGGKIIKGASQSLKKIKLSDLGFAKKIEIKKDSTTIIKGNGNEKKIKSKIKELEKELSKCFSDYDSEKLKERISKLSGGIATIKVGGFTESEVKERKYRIEDALNATKAAIEEGVVPGGGIALIRVAEWMKKKIKNNKKNIGFNILLKSMYAPFFQIIKNGGIEPKIILNKIKNKKYYYGYDLSNNKFCNLLKKGIIDPTKVVKTALKNAVSISSLLLATECVIINNNNKNTNNIGNLT
ncbi:chaperonin GroEL [Candidatus Vidania fulgoroideorum]